MASLSYKIRAYLDRNVNFRSDVILQDDGSGAYIKEWNVAEPEPTESQLQEYDAAGDAIYHNEVVIHDRVVGYGSFGDQLDMMYWDEVNGTTTWKDHIAKVKADNPKG
jgi:hypothetical protein|tara:strand:- start:749 stop:1072 length:324 start_codon:yes stop_codon:yes gene_type:complete